MMDLEDLYQEVILDHCKQPRNFGRLNRLTHQAEGFNPLCGDQVNIQLRVVNNCVQEAGFEGCGCAISTASASILTELVKGKTREEIADLAERFREVLLEHKEHELGDLEVLCGVRNFPMRVKCATLAWHAVLEALDSPTEEGKSDDA